jgi:hypothetical protein
MLQEKFAPPRLAGTPLHVTAETPDKASLTVPASATPAAEKVVPSAGEVTFRTGGVLSMLRVTLAVAEVPAVSVTVPVTT